MKISSGNSPAFGCGACAQINKIAPKFEKIKVPGLPGTCLEGFKYAVKYEQQKGNLTHGQAASKVYKQLKATLPMIQKILKEAGQTHL
jgi:hypothetical protein